MTRLKKGYLYEFNKNSELLLGALNSKGDSILKAEDGDKLGHLTQFPGTARKPIFDVFSKSKQPTHHYFLTTKFRSPVPSRRPEAINLVHHKMGTGESPRDYQREGNRLHRTWVVFAIFTNSKDSASSLNWLSHCFFRHPIAFKVIKHNKKTTFPVSITNTYWSSWSTQKKACSNLEEETKNAVSGNYWIERKEIRLQCSKLNSS